MTDELDPPPAIERNDRMSTAIIEELKAVMNQTIVASKYGGQRDRGEALAAIKALTEKFEALSPTPSNREE